MQSVRINISLPKELLDEVSSEVAPRRRSRFIAEAVERLLRARQAERLAAEYREAAAEIQCVNKDLEGAISDGLD